MARGRRSNGEGTVRQRKDGRWEGKLMVGYRPDGRPDMRYVYGATEKEALDRLLEVRMQKHRGTLPKPDVVTLADYVSAWLPYHEQYGNHGRGCRPNTMQNYRNAWKHLEPILGKNKLKDLRPEHLRRAYDRITAKVQEASGGAKTGRRAAELAHRFLHLLLESALEEGLIARNPCRMLKDKPKSQKKERPILTTDQARQALEAARGRTHYPALLLLMVTGARRNEVLGLRWRDLDLLTGQVSITKQIHFEKGGTWTFGPPKSEAGSRVVPIPEDVAEALLAHKQAMGAEDDDFVCAVRGGKPLRHDDLDHRWSDMRKALELPEGIVLHDLRHSYITWQAEAGTNPKAVAQIVGHSDERTTMRIYQKVTAKMERMAAGAVRGLVPPSAQ